jgi:meso-butanediol dehydrogenase/(S,S)-butanediol dehydrogenase/diacetyl reductase
MVPASEQTGTPPRVAIVTGAGSGIGRACALKFSSEGCAVVVSDRDEKGARDTHQRIGQNGGESIYCVTDITSDEQCLTLAQSALDKWGRIDMLVANAGVQMGGELADANRDEWEAIMGVNSLGTAYCCKAVLPAMVAMQAGSIVITSSVNAITATPGMPIYDMSKAAVLGLMRSLAADYGARGIRVNAVCPGNTITDFHISRMAERGISEQQIRDMTRGYALLKRAAEPAEIANAIYFLASEEASFITGQALCVDGGYSVTGGSG